MPSSSVSAAFRLEVGGSRARDARAAMVSEACPAGAASRRARRATSTGVLEAVQDRQRRRTVVAKREAFIACWRAREES